MVEFLPIKPRGLRYSHDLVNGSFLMTACFKIVSLYSVVNSTKEYPLQMAAPVPCFLCQLLLLSSDKPSGYGDTEGVHRMGRACHI